MILKTYTECDYAASTHYVFDMDELVRYVMFRDVLAGMLGIHWADRPGAQAVRRLEVQDFPVTMVNETHGGGLYQEGKSRYRVKTG